MTHDPTQHRTPRLLNDATAAAGIEESLAVTVETEEKVVVGHFKDI